MKTFTTFSIAAVLIAVPASAAEHYAMTRMTCDQITGGMKDHRKALLQSDSKKVPGMTLYSMYSAERSMCIGGQAPTNKYVKVKDGTCKVVQCVTPGHAWYRP